MIPLTKVDPPEPWPYRIFSTHTCCCAEPVEDIPKAWRITFGGVRLFPFRWEHPICHREPNHIGEHYDDICGYVWG